MLIKVLIDYIDNETLYILKNTEKSWDEYFYHHFIPNVDYIEILYNDNEKGLAVVNRITNTLQKYNDEQIQIIANSGYQKAIEIFKLSNVYG